MRWRGSKVGGQKESWTQPHAHLPSAWTHAERVRKNADASKFKAEANDCPSTSFISFDLLEKVARTLKPAPGRGGNVKIFCATYTHKKNHADRIKTVYDSSTTLG